MAVADLTASLPYGQMAATGNSQAAMFGSNPAQAYAALGPAYNQAYQSSLGFNQALEQGSQTGYQGLRSQVDQQYQDVLNNYQNTYGDVLGKIANTNATNINDINTQYNALQGQSAADLANRGLGSSSLVAGNQRAVEMDRQRAITNSQGQFAQLGAGYLGQMAQGASQIGQQGAQAQAGLGQAQLNQLNSVQAPYPNAQMYGQLAQMYGATQQANANRAMQQQALNQAGARQPVGSGAMGNQLSPFSGPQMNGYNSTGSSGGGGFVGGGGFFSPSPYTPSSNSSWNQGNSDTSAMFGDPTGQAQGPGEGSGEGDLTPYSNNSLYSGGYGGTGDYGYDPAAYG